MSLSEIPRSSKVTAGVTPHQNAQPILNVANEVQYETQSFDSVEYIMRDVQWGWLIRYMHSTGASLFFIVIYLHMFRGLMYDSYQSRANWYKSSTASSI